MTTPEPNTTVKVSHIPLCDINTLHGPAYADAKLPRLGPWAYVCKDCFNRHGCSLGLGRGQILIKVVSLVHPNRPIM